MVSDLARNPKFAPEELERQRQQILSGLKVGYEDPDYIAGMVFDRLVYGFHPYGRPDSGTPESIASIKRNDLVAFHKAYFGANNAILAIVGDINHEEAFAGAERVFGNWGRAESAIPTPPDPPAADAAPCRHRSARSGPDRDPRRQHRVAPPPQGLPGARPGGQYSGRRGREQAASSAALGSRLDLRRFRRRERLEGRRQHRRRHGHAIGSDGRGPAPHRRRVLAPATSARAGRRARGCEGLPDGQLSPDDRDAERDRAPGSECGFLRPGFERAPDLSRACECDQRRRHPACRARVPAPRSAFHRSCRRCLRFHQAARRRRVRPLRTHRPLGSRSRIRGSQAARSAGEPIRAGGVQDHGSGRCATTDDQPGATRARRLG